MILTLMIGWFIMLYFTMCIRPNGRTVQFFNIAQLLFGLSFGLDIMGTSLLLGFGISFVSVGIFAGLVLYKDI